MIRAFACVVCAVTLAACATAPRGEQIEGDLALLERWMTGSFSSAAQADADPENYRDIRLHMRRIWPDRPGGPWLYVEQAAAASLEAPYRQRVYRLSEGEKPNTFESHVFELPGDPLIYAGAWKTPELLDGVSIESLQAREGCAIVLEFGGESFSGSTIDKRCISTLRGAAYATSEVLIEEHRLISWDRGFDAEGVQKWGATEGGYVFDKEPARALNAPTGSSQSQKR